MDYSDIITRVQKIADRNIQTRLNTGSSVSFELQLSEELHTDYEQLNTMFLAKYDMSLDVVFTKRIIEKVKELLVYTEQSIAQIAKALGYRKTSELSEQLLAYTGLSAVHFKQIRKNKQDIIRTQQKQNGL